MQYSSFHHSFVDLAARDGVRPTGRMRGPGEPGPEDCSGKGCRAETRDRPECGAILPALAGLTASHLALLIGPQGQCPQATGVAAISVRLRPACLAALRAASAWMISWLKSAG